MPTCDTCGADYDRTFEVRMAGKSHVFDSFECAIHALAPQCATCGIKSRRSRHEPERQHLLL
jgi:hypothetical protein